MVLSRWRVRLGVAVAAILPIVGAQLSLLPLAAADHLPAIEAEYGEPVLVEVPSLHTETITFDGQSGDRVSISMQADWTATGTGELYAPGDVPGTDDPIVSHDLYGWYTQDIPELTATGTYTLVLSSQGAYTTDFLVTVYKSATVQGTLEVDGSTERFRLKPADTLELSVDGEVGQAISIWAPGVQEWSDVDGAFDATMRLLSPSDAVVWDSATTDSPYGLLMENVALPSTGTYTLEVDPHWDAAGDLALRAAEIPPADAIELSEGVRAAAELEVPGQDALFTFDAELGDRIALSDIVAPYDAEVSLTGPSNQLWHADVYSRTFDDIWIPETGTYELLVNGHLDAGGVRAKYVEVPADQAIQLDVDGTPQVVTPTSDRQRINFEFDFEPFEPFGVRLASSSVGGDLTARSPWWPNGSGAGYLDPGVIKTVAFPFSWGQGSQYGLTLKPSVGSTGSLSAWVVPTTTPPDVYGAVTANSGPVAASSRWNEFETELEPDTTYRLRVVQDDTATADFYAYGDGISIDGTANDSSEVVEFTTPSGSDPNRVWLAVSRSVEQGDLGEASDATVEIYSTASAPEIQTYLGPTASSDVSVRWSVDALDAPIDGYAVVVDQNATTDPGTTVTQTDAVYVPTSTLTPGTHWIHVRAVDGQAAGAVSHAEIKVVAPSVASTPDAPLASPGSPGAVTAQAATLTVPVPAVATDVAGARFVVRSTDGKQEWNGSGVVDQGQVQAALPGAFLKPGRMYEARAQFVDVNDVPGVMGATTGFAFDPVSPIVPAPPCSGSCNAASTVLFDGDIVAAGDESLDLESLTNVGDGNWAEYVNLEVEADPSSDALLRFEPGVEDPELELPPTMLVAAGDTATVRVVPDDVFTATVTNEGASTAKVKITATGWAPGWTSADDAQEAAIETEADRMLASNEVGEDWQPPTLDPTEALPETTCTEEDDVCVTFSPDSPDEEEELQSRSSARSDTMNLDDEPLGCDVGSSSGRWVVTDRFNACTTFKVDVFKASLPVPTMFKLRAFQRIKLSNRGTEILYQYKIRMRGATGSISNYPIQANVEVECDICRNGDLPTKSTGAVSTSSLFDQESKWAEQRIPIEALQSDTHMVITETGGVRPTWSWEIAGLPDGGSLFPRTVGLPAVHCEGGNSIFFGSKYSRTNGGCTLFYAPTPILSLDPSSYPKHSRLVRRGQALPGHPGEPSEEGFPLTRLPVWVSSVLQPVPKRNSFYLKNRSEAKKLCKDRNIGSPLTCDEYPYASTTEGCFVSSNPVGRKCEVLGTTQRENSSAGGKLSAFLYKYRIRVGEKYFVNVTNFSNPT